MSASTSTSGDKPTTAVISVPTGTATSGTDPIYNLSLYSTELSSYGNSSNNETAFMCANDGCRFTVVSHGYNELWRAIMSTLDLKATPPYAELNSLGNGTNYYKLPSINQNRVDWRNESREYVWALFDSEDGPDPIATSNVFQMHIDGWNYRTGLPQAESSGTKAGKGQGSSLSGGAIAGIVIGVLLIIIIALMMLFLLRRRKRKARRTRPSPSVALPSDPLPSVHEKGVDNPTSKPELVGSTTTNRGAAYSKPELSATARLLPSELSSSQGTNTLHEEGSASSQGADVPYQSGAGAPMDRGHNQEKQLIESERLTHNFMEVRHPQTEDTSSPATGNQYELTPASRPATHENLNVLKAQEREMAHQMEVSEELQRMRAEHTALLDRIRLAEMREREVRGGS